MALDRQQISLQFEGTDTKTAPQLLAPGKFIALENCVRRKTGKIEKRNGLSNLVQGGSVSLTSGNHVDLFQNDLLVMDDTHIYTYNSSNDELINRGYVTSAEVDTSIVVRNSYRQAMPDAAYGGGKSVFVWQDSRGVGSAEEIRYSVFDDSTGTAIVRDASLSTSGSTPRVVALNDRFLVFYRESTALRSRIIYFNSPGTISNEATVTTVASGPFDACLYGTNQVAIAYMTSGTAYAVGLVVASGAIGSGVNGAPVPLAGSSGSTVAALSISASSEFPGYIWLYYSNATKIVANVTAGSLLGFASVDVESAANVRNITAVANTATTSKVYYEQGVPATVAACKNQLIRTATASFDGTLATISIAATTFARSVGLGGKVFLDGSFLYIPAAYESALQSSFYLIRSDGFIVARLSPGVYGGLTRTAQPGTVPSPADLQNGLPSFYINADGAYVYPTTIKTKFQATLEGIVYSPSQGIQRSAIMLTGGTYTGSTVGGNYHLSGGILFDYDGNSPVEHGFLTYPEDTTTTVGDLTFVAADVNVGSDTITITAHGYVNTNTLTLTNSGGALPASLVAGTTYYIINAAANTFKLSTSSGGAAVNITDAGTGTQTVHNTTGGSLPVGTYYYAVMYEWMDAQGQIHRSTPNYVNQATTVINQKITVTYPTLRLTLKDGSTRANCRVVLYRGIATDDDQVLYRLTDAVNSTSADTGTFIDTGSVLSAANLAVQEVLYTTGGVIENTAPPASKCLTSYRGRLFLGGLEDRNSMAYSKPHVYGEGLAFSDFFVQRCDSRGGDIRSLAAMDDKLVIFKKDVIFTMVGDGPVDTGVNNDYADPQLVATDVGCSTPNSIVLMPNGLMFKSDKGIYLLDRSLSTSYIGAAVERFNDLTITSAVVMEDQNEVRFTTSDGVCLVYNYFYNLWSWFTNYEAVSAVGSSSGYYHLKSDGTLRIEDTSYNDAGSTYKMSIETGWISFAGVQGYQRIYDIYGLGDFISDHYTRIKLAYDFEDAYTETVYFNVDAGLDLAYYGDGATYGADSPYGGSGSSVYQWQLGPRRQKCQSIKLLIEDIDNKTVNGGASFAFVSLSFLAGIKPAGPKFGSSKSIGSLEG